MEGKLGRQMQHVRESVYIQSRIRPTLQGELQLAAGVHLYFLQQEFGQVHHIQISLLQAFHRRQIQVCNFKNKYRLLATIDVLGVKSVPRVLVYRVFFKITFCPNTPKPSRSFVMNVGKVL